MLSRSDRITLLFRGGLRTSTKSKSGQNRDFFYVVLDPGKMPYSRIGAVPIAPKTRTNGLSSSWNIPNFVSRVIPGISFGTFRESNFEQLERKMAILGSRYVSKNTFLTGRVASPFLFSKPSPLHFLLEKSTWASETL